MLNPAFITSSHASYLRTFKPLFRSYTSAESEGKEIGKKTDVLKTLHVTKSFLSSYSYAFYLISQRLVWFSVQVLLFFHRFLYSAQHHMASISILASDHHSPNTATPSRLPACWNTCIGAVNFDPVVIIGILSLSSWTSNECWTSRPQVSISEYPSGLLISCAFPIVIPAHTNITVLATRVIPIPPPECIQYHMWTYPLPSRHLIDPKKYPHVTITWSLHLYSPPGVSSCNMAVKVKALSDTYVKSYVRALIVSRMYS